MSEIKGAPDKFFNETLTRKLRELENHTEEIQLTLAFISEYDQKRDLGQWLIAMKALVKLLNFPWDEYKDYIGLGVSLVEMERRY